MRSISAYVLLAALLPSLTNAKWHVSQKAARRLVAQMTTEEKQTWVRGSGWSTYSHPDAGMYIGNTPGIPRLGIPALKMYDGPQGWRAGWGVIEGNQLDQVTAWPSGLAVAATWHAKRMREYSSGIAREFRKKGANTILGPSVDLARAPKNGRMPESIAGEDPYFASVMATAYVQGVHSQGVLATMKHFIGNTQETNRQFYNSVVDQRTLWQVYYAPYYAAIRSAKLSAVMCAYNRVLGKHSCEQSSTLKVDLKGTMGFNGWVMTDWWASHGKDASNEGLDQAQPGFSQGDHGKGDEYSDFVDQSARNLNSMVERMLAPMIEHGLLSDKDQCDPPACDHELYDVESSDTKQRALAVQLASEGAVLLKNNGVLPIGVDVKKLAIVGDACAAPNVLTDLGWNEGTYYSLGGSGRTLSSRTKSIAQGVLDRAHMADLVEVVMLTDKALDEAVLGAADADLVLICGGATSGEDRDREHLLLDQHDFIKDFLERSRVPSIVAMSTPGPVVVTAWKDSAAAIVNMFLAGEATGQAWAAILFGDVNPSGKLPVTFPVSEEEAIPLCPTSGDCVYSEKLEIGYRGLSLLAVDFPFGHGLSYTMFQYAWVEEPAKCKSKSNGVGVVCLQVSVTNTGTVAGAEVAQLYLRFPEALGEPERVLKGFDKVFLEAGEAAIITFTLSHHDLSVWDHTSRKWAVGHGHFMALVGSSSKDIRLVSTFHNAGDISVAPPEDPDFPEACPGNSMDACKMQCTVAEETDDAGIEECKSSICAERCGAHVPDYLYSLKTGCSNGEDLIISSFDYGQGNCRAFCAREKECKAYQLGRTDGEEKGKCVLLRDGCEHTQDDLYDFYQSTDGDVETYAVYEQQSCVQCWLQEGQDGEDNACGYWCGRAMDEGCESVGCSSSECDFCGST